MTTDAAGPDPYQTALLRDLIAFPSVNPPGGEQPVAEYLAGRLRELGFHVETPLVAPGRANVVARFVGGDGPDVALTGHLDVVAAAPDQWSSDPFVLRDAGSRLYGRGVCDMKGAISSMVAAARDFLAGGSSFKGTLTLLFVADEESTTLGTLGFLASGKRPDMAILGEPTGMNVCTAHRGVARYNVAVTGRSGHAARPEQAVNAVTIAARLADRIDRHNAILSRRTHPVLPPPTIAVTMIEGGEQPNTIPGSCRLTVDRRTLPDETKESLLAEFNALRESLAPDEAACAAHPDFTVFTGAGHTLPGSHLADRCVAALSRVGVEAQVHDFPAGCDQFAFTAAGVDCVLVGPGELAQAHIVDEFVEKRQLALARAFYREFIRERLQ